MAKVTGIKYDKSCYHYSKLADCHIGEVIIDGKLLTGNIVDNTIKEWWTDNTTHYSFKKFEHVQTFREHIRHARKMFFLLNSDSDKKTFIFIVYTDENEWWELTLSDNILYCKRIKTQCNEFESIFKVFYSVKYKDWIDLKISEGMSVTKRMKIVSEYINPEDEE